MNKISYLFIIIVLITGCNGHNKPGHKDSLKTNDSLTSTSKSSIPKANQDSIKLTDLVRNLYKWHETYKMQADGFKPLKRNPSDTLYSGIDLNENKKATDELKQTGLFADDFLDDYRKIAARMDKELQDGTSLWPEGELPTFNDDVDEWCNCQDFPVNDYWKIIRLTDIKFSKGEASFKWTWGDNFYYKTKAKDENGTWKISYLEGFDMNYYNWEWVTKHRQQ